ncbi:MAG: hypothetical protein Q9182_003708 [Xanthomendoza sp. 2 TL-2023]
MLLHVDLMLLIKTSKSLASPSVSISSWYEKELWMTLNLVCTDTDGCDDGPNAENVSPRRSHATDQSVQNPGFTTHTDGCDVDSPEEDFHITEPPNQTSSSPQGRNPPGLTNQEDVSVENFLRSQVSDAVPWSTGLKSHLLPCEEKAAGLDRASLKSHFQTLLDQGMDDFIDAMIRAIHRAHEDKIQKAIEAEWAPRLKAWLRQQLAQFRAENRQHWRDTEGEQYREEFLEQLEEARNKQEAKQQADLEQEWKDGKRYQYHKQLKSQLALEVKRELREELTPIVTKELQTKFLSAPRPEAQRDIVGDIEHYQRTLGFSQYVGSRIRAESSEEQIDSERDPMGRVREASERLNSTVESGRPDHPENRRSIDTDAYIKGLFNIFPLDAPSHGPHIHHPQPIQSATISNGQQVPPRAVRNHGIVGEPIIPRRIHALQDESTATQPSVAARYNSNQRVPGLDTGRPSSMLAPERGKMLPPPRPAGPKPASQLHPLQINRMRVESTRPESLMEGGEASKVQTLLEAHNSSMAMQHAHEQADNDRSKRDKIGTGERRDSLNKSLVPNGANKDGGIGPAELGQNTANLDAHAASMAPPRAHEQAHNYPGEIDAAQIQSGRYSLSKPEASKEINIGGNEESVPVKLGVRTVDSNETQSLAQQQSQDKGVQEHSERDRNKTDSVQVGKGRDPPIRLETFEEADVHGRDEPAPAHLGVQPITCDKTHVQTQRQDQEKQVQDEQADKDRNETGRVQIRQHPDPPTQPQTSNKDGKDSLGESEISDSELKTTDSYTTDREVRQQGQEAQTGNSVSQTSSVPSQRRGKKRARPVDDGTENVDIRHDKDGSQNKEAKRETKRARHDPAQQNEGPSTRTRAATRKAAVGKPKASARRTRTAGSMLGKTTADATATAVASAGGGGRAGSTRPLQLPPQEPANTRARAAVRSGQLKRGLELEEADEEDEARTSRPSAKRVRHTVMGEHGETNPPPDVAAAFTDTENGPSSTSKAEQEKSTAGPSKGNSLQSEPKEEARKSTRPSRRKTPASLGSPFVLDAGPRQPRVRTEWDTDSDD